MSTCNFIRLYMFALIPKLGLVCINKEKKKYTMHAYMFMFIEPSLSVSKDQIT